MAKVEKLLMTVVKHYYAHLINVNMKSDTLFSRKKIIIIQGK